MFEIGDKVKVDTEGYVGFAYIRNFARDGAYVSVERCSREFFVKLSDLRPTR